MDGAIVAAGITLAVTGVSSLGTIAVRGALKGIRQDVKAAREAAAATSEVLAQRLETIRQEVRAELSAAGNEFYARVNGTYVRRERFDDLVERVGRVEDKLERIE